MNDGTKFFAYLRPDEDGRPFRLLVDEADLSEFLADPEGFAGITEFKDAAFLGAQADPNYWREGTGMLLECRVVVPRMAGAFVLPPDVTS